MTQRDEQLRAAVSRVDTDLLLGNTPTRSDCEVLIEAAKREIARQPASEAARWVQQTRLHRHGEPPGNCFASCIASVLAVPLDSVPQPGEDDRDDWGDYWLRFAEWLYREHGMQVVRINLPAPLPASDDATAWPYWSSASSVDGPDGLAILSGKSPRGEHLHSVVVRGTELFHDPHPSGAGLDGRFTCLEFLVPLDPRVRQPASEAEIRRAIDVQVHPDGIRHWRACEAHFGIGRGAK